MIQHGQTWCLTAYTFHTGLNKKSLEGEERLKKGSGGGAGKKNQEGRGRRTEAKTENREGRGGRKTNRHTGKEKVR